MTSLEPEKGNLLIAEPSIIGDVSFNRSVILVAENNANGSIGFILNKPLSHYLKDLVPEVENLDFKIYYGGPVEQDNLYFIHKIPELVDKSIEIANGIYWGGDFTTLMQLINDEKITENDVRFFLGYSGWSPNQLKEELELNSWIVSKNTDHKKIIERSFINFWKEKMKELGGQYTLWANAPENPQDN